MHTCPGNIYKVSQCSGALMLYLNRTILMNVIRIDGAQAGLLGKAAEEKSYQYKKKL